jgi:fucose permease
MTTDKFALAFSMGIFAYVATECAIYVWMPTLIKDAKGFFALYALTIFFVLRAAGRFLGAWVLSRFDWTTVLVLFSGAILACFVGSVLLGVTAAVYLLPLSGLFMSVVYPTLNSKGISCFQKSQHGAVAGVILFFTCGAAALGPLAMGVVSDVFGDPKFGFVLATLFAALLFGGSVYNFMRQPAKDRLGQLDRSEYATATSALDSVPQGTSRG